MSLLRRALSPGTVCLYTYMQTHGKYDYLVIFCQTVVDYDIIKDHTAHIYI